MPAYPCGSTFSHSPLPARGPTGLPAKLPVHLVGGSADPSTVNGDAIGWLGQRMKARGMADVTVTIYPGMRHETLNEVGRETATEDFAAWCLQAIGSKRRVGERI